MYDSMSKTYEFLYNLLWNTCLVSGWKFDIQYFQRTFSFALWCVGLEKLGIFDENVIFPHFRRRKIFCSDEINQKWLRIAQTERSRSKKKPNISFSNRSTSKMTTCRLMWSRCIFNMRENIKKTVWPNDSIGCWID